MAKPSRQATAVPTPTPRATKVRQEHQRREKYFRQRYPRLDDLPIVHRHAAGVDLGGRTSHFVAFEVGEELEVREFGMTTEALVATVLDLRAAGVTTVAMEATGVYWAPLYDLLEAQHIEVFLVNPAHAKNVPGRPKSDKLDCRWLQRLHKYGLLSASFRPPAAWRPVRNLYRHRTRQVQQAADALRRMQKVLDQMNVRPHQAVSDLGGVTGMRIVRAIVAGERDPAVLARLRDPRCAVTEAELVAELTGVFAADAVWQLASHRRTYDHFLAEIARVDAALEEALTALVPGEAAPWPERRAADPHPLPLGKHAPAFNAAAYVTAILGQDPTALPGIGPQIALGLLCELGPDLCAWPTAKHLGSYLGVAPVPKISGGRLLSARTRAGTHPAAVLLRQAAAAIVRADDTALAAFYHRLAKRIGKGKALTALAYKLLRMYYHLVQDGSAYVEAGAAAYEAQYQQRQRTALEKRARHMGYTLTPIAA